METEKRIAEYVCGADYDDLAPDAVEVVKKQLLTVLGTTIAGASAEGCGTVLGFYRGLAGREEASVLVHGGKLPALHAAFINGAMARALDFCDAMVPGAHIGSAAVPAALAAAELAGGCSGREFLAALAAGAEVAVRLNLKEPDYDGFDPTGVCVVFAATAAVAKILGLGETETLNALALAFNRCGGSFQSNIDGSLAVRVIEGWVAETGVTCALLAGRGITGPGNFLEGVYGYFHLFGKDRVDREGVTGGLGSEYRLDRIVFKKYPSCGLTQACTEMALSLRNDDGLEPDGIGRIGVRVPPYAYRLVGRPFETGANPKVDAQFSIAYCVANALLRGSAKLAHFEETSVRDPEVLALAAKVRVVSDPAMEKRGHTAADLFVSTTGGEEHMKRTEIAPGAPGNPLSASDHEARFRDCIDFATVRFPVEKVEKIIGEVENFEAMGDVRSMIPLLVAERA